MILGLFKNRKTGKVSKAFGAGKALESGKIGGSGKSIKQTGRTLLEMLMVLAITGVLSVVALVGFTYAMNKHKANETIYDVMLRGTNVPMVDENYATREVGHKFRFSGLGDGVYYEMETVKDGGASYYVEAFDVPYRVCKHILKMQPTDINQIVVGDMVFKGDNDICGSEDGLSMKFCFGEDGEICDGTGLKPGPDPDPWQDPCMKVPEIKVDGLLYSVESCNSPCAIDGFSFTQDGCEYCFEIKTVSDCQIVYNNGCFDEIRKGTDGCFYCRQSSYAACPEGVNVLYRDVCGNEECGPCTNPNGCGCPECTYPIDMVGGVPTCQSVCFGKWCTNGEWSIGKDKCGCDICTQCPEETPVYCKSLTDTWCCGEGKVCGPGVGKCLDSCPTEKPQECSNEVTKWCCAEGKVCGQEQDDCLHSCPKETPVSCQNETDKWCCASNKICGQEKGSCVCGYECPECQTLNEITCLCDPKVCEPCPEGQTVIDQDTCGCDVCSVCPLTKQACQLGEETWCCAKDEVCGQEKDSCLDNCPTETPKSCANETGKWCCTEDKFCGSETGSCLDNCPTETPVSCQNETDKWCCAEDKFCGSETGSCLDCPTETPMSCQNETDKWCCAEDKLCGSETGSCLDECPTETPKSCANETGKWCCGKDKFCGTETGSCLDNCPTEKPVSCQNETDKWCCGKDKLCGEETGSCLDECPTKRPILCQNETNTWCCAEDKACGTKAGFCTCQTVEELACDSGYYPVISDSGCAYDCVMVCPPNTAMLTTAYTGSDPDIKEATKSDPVTALCIGLTGLGDNGGTGGLYSAWDECLKQNCFWVPEGDPFRGKGTCCCNGDNEVCCNRFKWNWCEEIGQCCKYMDQCVVSEGRCCTVKECAYNYNNPTGAIGSDCKVTGYSNPTTTGDTLSMSVSSCGDGKYCNILYSESNCTGSLDYTGATTMYGTCQLLTSNAGTCRQNLHLNASIISPIDGCASGTYCQILYPNEDRTGGLGRTGASTMYGYCLPMTRNNGKCSN